MISLHSVDIVIDNGATEIEELPVPWRGLIHRITAARLGQNTSDVTVRVYEAAAIEDLGTIAAGDRIQYLVAPIQASADHSGTAGHIAYFNDSGIPYKNQDSSMADKERKLYIELTTGGAGGGTYRVTIMVDSASSG